MKDQRNENLLLLERERKLLEGDIDKLDADALDWKPSPSTNSIATSLLHVAAVEYLVASAATLANGEPINRDLWAKLKPGLARELGIAEQSKHGLDHYRGLLGAVRAELARTLIAGKEKQLTPSDLESAVTALGLPDAEAKIVKGAVARKMAARSMGQSDVGQFLAVHEAYHRGQITLKSHLYRQQKAAKPAS